MIQVCLNGARTRAEHAGLPLSPLELAEAAAGAVAAGAQDIHMHVRGRDGEESLASDDVAAAVVAVRAACPGMTVGVSTGLWVTGGDPERRLSHVGAWPATALPDHASVNVDEEGWLPLAEVLLATGVAVDPGLSAPRDAVTLVESGIAPRCRRILLEPDEDDPVHALETADRIEALLQEAIDVVTLTRAAEDGGVASLSRQIAGVAPPSGPAGPVPLSDVAGRLMPRRLRHGFGGGAWAVLASTAGREEDTRIGLEDTLVLPDGSPAPDNAALVRAAVEMLG